MSDVFPTLQTMNIQAKEEVEGASAEESSVSTLIGCDCS